MALCQVRKLLVLHQTSRTHVIMLGDVSTAFRGAFSRAHVQKGTIATNYTPDMNLGEAVQCSPMARQLE